MDCRFTFTSLPNTRAAMWCPMHKVIPHLEKVPCLLVLATYRTTLLPVSLSCGRRRKLFVARGTLPAFMPSLRIVYVTRAPTINADKAQAPPGLGHERSSVSQSNSLEARVPPRQSSTDQQHCLRFRGPILDDHLDPNVEKNCTKVKCCNVTLWDVASRFSTTGSVTTDGS